MADTFKAAVWNVYHGTPTDDLAAPLLRQMRKGVGLFFMSEAGGRDITAMLHHHQLQTYVYDQYRLAWDPGEWLSVIDFDLRLSPTAYYAKGEREPQYADAVRVILSDYEGRTLDAISYHSPAHIQNDNPPERRYQAFVESMRSLGRLAEHSECRGWLAAGDDNWDEDTGKQTVHTKPLFLGEAIGLRQLQAGAPTFGRREIDDFRIKRGGGIKPVSGVVWVDEGGGAEKPAHKIHGREFRWVG